jgi:hypothetical protein
MANETYTLIQKTTLNASAASITFSSIPQTFTDLVVMCSLRNATASTAQSGWVKFNGSSTGYAHKYLGGDGASASSAGDAAATRIYIGQVDGATATANTFANVSIYIPNYTSANYKSVSIDGVQETNATTAYATLSAGLWSNTAAITSISLETTAGDYVQYSSASLYGVAKFGVTPVAGPKASGGDIITNDGTYWIHQFLNSGTFTPNRTLSCDYLVVAGGGSGGNGNGAGGGAGGLRSTVTATGGGGSLESPLSLTAQAYTVTIGAGGAARGATAGNGNVGNNSVFATITSDGGGFGGGNNNNIGSVGGNGGSGGGSSAGVPTAAGGTATANQGFNGATTVSHGSGAAGGGGGAGAVGSTNSSGTGGAGGVGGATSISGSSVTYAGGGGGGGNPTGGTGGAGGGGNGGITGSTAGAANTGGGGGGNNGNGTTTAGGSGIVIIRYAM